MMFWKNRAAPTLRRPVIFEVGQTGRVLVSKQDLEEYPMLYRQLGIGAPGTPWRYDSRWDGFVLEPHDSSATL